MRKKSTQKKSKRESTTTRHDARLSTAADLLLVCQRSVNSRAVSNQFADFSSPANSHRKSHRVGRGKRDTPPIFSSNSIR